MLRRLMRTLLGLLIAALLLLLPHQPAEAATAQQAPRAAAAPADLRSTYALVIDGLNTRNGGVLDPGITNQLRTCPICLKTGRPVCPPNPCR